MNSKVFKSVRNLVGVAVLAAGCGGAEPIPVDLATAKEPCEYGNAFVTEGMRMVMRDGHLTVEPEAGTVKASWAWLGTSVVETGTTAEPTGCSGCH